MPYIKSNDGRRELLQKREVALNAGELNYQIFYFVKHYYLEFTPITSEIIIKMFVKNFLGEKPNYQKYNDMTGALIRCYRECQRRLGIKCYMLLEIMDSYDEEIAKYEDIKIRENGDVE